MMSLDDLIWNHLHNDETELEARFQYLNGTEFSEQKFQEIRNYLSKDCPVLHEKKEEASFDLFADTGHKFERQRISIPGAALIKDFLCYVKVFKEKKTTASNHHNFFRSLSIDQPDLLNQMILLKKKKGKYTMDQYSFRIRMDTEHILQTETDRTNLLELFDDNQLTRTLRYKKRYSFILYKGIIRVDVTKIYQCSLSSSGLLSQLNLKYIDKYVKPHYELEVELQLLLPPCSGERSTDSNMVTDIKEKFEKTLQNLQNKLYDTKYSFTNKEFWDVYDNYHQLIGQKKHPYDFYDTKVSRYHSNNMKMHFIGPNVVSFLPKHLTDMNITRNVPNSMFSVTNKRDGLRKIAFISKNALFLLDKKFNFSCLCDFTDISTTTTATTTTTTTTSYNNTILDGEYANHQFHIFDVYFFQGMDVRHISHVERLSLAKSLLMTLPSDKKTLPPLRMKDFYFPKHTFRFRAKMSTTNNAWRNRSEHQYSEKLSHVCAAKGQWTMQECISHLLLKNEKEKEFEEKNDGLIFTHIGPLIDVVRHKDEKDEKEEEQEKEEDEKECSNHGILQVSMEDYQEEVVSRRFFNTGVIWKNVIKWKPRELLSNDLQVEDIQYKGLFKGHYVYKISLYTRNTDVTFGHTFFRDESYRATTLKPFFSEFCHYILLPAEDTSTAASTSAAASKIKSEKEIYCTDMDGKKTHITNGSIIELVYNNDDMYNSDARTFQLEGPEFSYYLPFDDDVDARDKSKCIVLWKFLRIREDKPYPNLDYIAHENFMISVFPIVEADLLSDAVTHTHTKDETNEQNQSMTSLQTLYCNHDKYREKTAHKENIRPMAKFHQSIKSQVIETCFRHILQDTKNTSRDRNNVSVSVLDFACGRFTDINIYQSPGISERLKCYVGIDYAEDEIINNVNGAYKRLMNLEKSDRNLASKFLFLQGDCSLPLSAASASSYSYYQPLYHFLNYDQPQQQQQQQQQQRIDKETMDIRPFMKTTRLLKFCGIFSKQFPLITMQFALHYFFEENNETTPAGTQEITYSKLEGLLNNVDKLLLPGGLFVGTCFDRKKVQQLIRKKNQQNIIENNLTGLSAEYYEEKTDHLIYRIRSLNKNASKISVYIESIGQELIESPVDFSYFEKRCASYQLVPIANELLKELGIQQQQQQQQQQQMEREDAEDEEEEEEEVDAENERTISFKKFLASSSSSSSWNSLENNELKEFSFCNVVFAFQKKK